MKSIPDASVDMCLTDPPYATTACKWDVLIPFEPMWRELKRIVKPNGAICLFGSEPFSSALRMSNIKMFKYDWVWDKGNPTNVALANKQPLKYHELISIFYFKQACYFPQKQNTDKKNHSQGRSKIRSSESVGTIGRGRDDFSGKKYPRSIIEFKKHSSQCGLHPTQKPVALLEYLIKTYTLEGETVLDFTMGSGSTGVAAKNLNRKFIGIEKDEKYFEIAKERIQSSESKQESQPPLI